MASLIANPTLLWTAAAIGLAGYIAHQIADQPPTAPDAVAAPVEATVDDPTAGMIAELPSEDLIDGIVARPLFSPSRRPTAAAPPDDGLAEAVTDDKPTLELIGTMFAGDAPIALFKHPTEGLLRLRPGERIGGWTVVDIERRRVSLEHDDGHDILTLREDQIRPPSLRRPRNTGQARKAAQEAEEPKKAPEQPSELIRRPL